MNRLNTRYARSLKRRYEITWEGIKRNTRSAPDAMDQSARSISVLIVVILLARE